MRLLFAGTPAAAVPSLEALLGSRHEVVAVLTRPDARSGRGRSAGMSAVKARALEAGLEVLTPAKPGDDEFRSRLAELAVDAAPVVAYGALIPPSLLDVPAHGWVNLHFSVLPAWRGAAPVQHALIAGDEVTGASTFRLERGLDTGPVYGAMTETVRPDDTSGTLLDRLAQAGAGLLVATLDGIEDGSLAPQPQPDEGVSMAPKIDVAAARVDWTATAARVDRLVRACTPAPGAWTTLGADRLKLGPVRVSDVDATLLPGQLQVGKREVVVGTGTDPVVLSTVQAPGKKAMAAADWARGVRLAPGLRLGTEETPP